ncbi:ferric reductase-like transmembrane domain-containing protein [Rathayibacter sp. VKM Ac-2926]|uniref:ferredoxin reductase family protein n=1 Tax=Rathayibacter sp. VKM Ac-2926 TaxID=2929477 RepID=UPI001FB27ECC|nr:ferric reductase-like transmembrane domain-containing protein [Rathayibacter sp. VKM Ac-2926]MCJ1705543.1 ferric reductase-like transmembrane domain-containing protein [Rathayibacter sp. VKM Ac-2926]
MSTVLRTVRPAPAAADGPGVDVSSGERRRRALRRRRRSADALVTACVVSVAVAIALFLASGGPEAVTGIATALSAAGIVAGLVGTDLLLLMLVLAARIPWIDRTFGQDVATALHRRLGKPALLLILGHGLLLTVGYAMTDGLDLVQESLALYSGSDLLLALLATALLLLVVVTSLVAVRRRFAYEAWHAIHLLSYAAVLVAVPHQLSAGQVLAEGSVQRAYWIALYVAAFGSVAWFRFAVPVVRTVRHRIRVEAVETIAPGVFSLHLTGRRMRSLGAVGGQYAIWRFWSAGTWWHAHPVSFSAVPTDRTARITVRVLGAGTARLARLRPGTAVSIEGPYGIFTDTARTAPLLAVVAAGIGITPARALLEHSALQPGEATVLLRGADHAQDRLWDETGELVRRGGGTLYWMQGHRPSGSDTWLSAEALSRGVTLTSVFPRLLDSDLYVCGPDAWSELVLRDARSAGLPEHRIHVERFSW